jgi:putative ABC transport system permease protein
MSSRIYRKLTAIGRFLLNRKKIEHDMDAELRYHVERETEENIRRGMTPAEARRTALVYIGGIEQTKEECRDARAGRAWESTLQDIRYGFRVLRKNPGFTAIAILTLALGIGVNTAIFSVVYGVLIRPLPYQQGGQLVVLHQKATHAHLEDVPFAAKEIFDYRDTSHTLNGVVEHHSMVFLLLGKDFAERVQTAVVSANFFDVLGVRPMLGRTFVASDESHNADAVLILSYKYWKERHGGDPNIVGKVFQMNNRPHTVIGVLPPIPQYPSESDVYMPTSQCPTRSSAQFIQSRSNRMMTAFARLKPGVSLAQAQADLSTIAGRLERDYPETYRKELGYNIAAAPLQYDLTRGARPTFLVLLAASAFVLLIACANVANLLLARLLRLERELAVRTALGATKTRLLRQLLTESVLLSLAGGALGLALAPLTVNLLVSFAERFTTRAAEVRVDTPVLLFTLLVSMATALIFGLAPALSCSQQASDALRQGAGRATSSRSHQGLRSALVVAQVAVSFILLMGAGLMIRSFVQLQQVDPGFRPDHLLAMRLSYSFTSHSRPEDAQTLWDNLLPKIKALGGVESVGLTSNFPLNPGGIASGPGNNTFEIEGQPVPKGQLAPQVDITVSGDGYFETIRQPLIRGRTFTQRDTAKSLPVAVINQTMVQHRWQSTDPLGRRVTFDEGKTWVTIVGVVGDVREYGLDRPVEDEIYFPVRQQPFVNNLIVRTAMDPMSIAPLIRRVIHEVDPHIAVDRTNSVANFRDYSMAPALVTTTLLGIFAGLALLISASGIAAVMALSVTQRTHELGIRLALGASRQSIVHMVVRHGLKLAFLGTALGIVGSIGVTRLLASLLYATSPTDVLTFAAVSAFFLAVAAMACFLPTRQVTAIDPVIALRQE